MTGLFFSPNVSMIPAAALLLCFVGSLAVLLLGRPAFGSESGAKKSAMSRIGILIQSLGFAAAGVVVGRATLRLDLDAFARAAIVIALFAGFIGIFRAARGALGANWSFVARMRDDHRLVTDGPFAFVRHPIYSGLFLLLLAITVGLGTWSHLIIAVPLFAIGTGIRVAEEERLLREQFGAAYDSYAARVKRFLPGVF